MNAEINCTSENGINGTSGEEEVLKQIRKEIFLTAYSAGIAHIASAFSIVEVMYVLYEKGILRYDCRNPLAEDRDCFILSKGHGSLALYCELYRAGFFDRSTLRSFAKPDSILGGEPCYPLTPGVECSTGSLGHGLSYAAGLALAKKMDGRREKVYCLLGDGECEEGTVWEAVMCAVSQELHNLTILVDQNRLQKMDTVESIVGISSWQSYFMQCGCDTRCVQGHDVKAIEECLKEDNITNSPRVILLETVKGKGVYVMENDKKWHFKLPNRRELKIFMKELDISEEEIAACRKPM